MSQYTPLMRRFAEAQESEADIDLVDAAMPLPVKQILCPECSPDSVDAIDLREIV